MAPARIDSTFLEAAKTHANDLFKLAYAEARNRGLSGAGETTPPLFPNGVELIRFKFEVALREAAKLAVESEVAGPKPGS